MSEIFDRLTWLRSASASSDQPLASRISWMRRAMVAWMSMLSRIVDAVFQ
jgi:hypothetical protein